MPHKVPQKETQDPRPQQSRFNWRAIPRALGNKAAWGVVGLASFLQEAAATGQTTSLRGSDTTSTTGFPVTSPEVSGGFVWTPAWIGGVAAGSAVVLAAIIAGTAVGCRRNCSSEKIGTELELPQSFCQSEVDRHIDQALNCREFAPFRLYSVSKEGDCKQRKRVPFQAWLWAGNEGRTTLFTEEDGLPIANSPQLHALLYFALKEDCAAEIVSHIDDIGEPQLTRLDLAAKKKPTRKQERLPKLLRVQRLFAALTASRSPKMSGRAKTILLNQIRALYLICKQKLSSDLANERRQSRRISAFSHLPKNIRRPSVALAKLERDAEIAVVLKKAELLYRACLFVSIGRSESPDNVHHHEFVEHATLLETLKPSEVTELFALMETKYAAQFSDGRKRRESYTERLDNWRAATCNTLVTRWVGLVADSLRSEVADEEKVIKKVGAIRTIMKGLLRRIQNGEMIEMSVKTKEVFDGLVATLKMAKGIHDFSLETDCAILDVFYRASQLGYRNDSVRGELVDEARLRQELPATRLVKYTDMEAMPLTVADLIHISHMNRDGRANVEKAIKRRIQREAVTLGRAGSTIDGIETCCEEFFIVGLSVEINAKRMDSSAPDGPYTCKVVRMLKQLYAQTDREYSSVEDSLDAVFKFYKELHEYRVKVETGQSFQESFKQTLTEYDLKKTVELGADQEIESLPMPELLRSLRGPGKLMYDDIKESVGDYPECGILKLFMATKRDQPTLNTKGRFTRKMYQESELSLASEHVITASYMADSRLLVACLSKATDEYKAAESAGETERASELKAELDRLKELHALALQQLSDSAESRLEEMQVWLSHLEGAPTEGDVYQREVDVLTCVASMQELDPQPTLMKQLDGSPQLKRLVRHRVDPHSSRTKSLRMIVNQSSERDVQDAKGPRRESEFKARRDQRFKGRTHSPRVQEARKNLDAAMAVAAHTAVRLTEQDSVNV